jgi:hypothetical protein
MAGTQAALHSEGLGSTRSDAPRHSPGSGIVSELVRHNPGTDTDGSDNIGKVRTQLFDKGLLVARAGQEPAVKWEGIKRAEEA